MNWYNSNMQEFFINEKIDKPELGFDLMAKVKKTLMTPDVITAMRAGCHFEVSMFQDEKSITISLKLKEKISILKSPDGTPLSVMIQR